MQSVATQSSEGMPSLPPPPGRRQGFSVMYLVDESQYNRYRSEGDKRRDLEMQVREQEKDINALRTRLRTGGRDGSGAPSVSRDIHINFATDEAESLFANGGPVPRRRPKSRGGAGGGRGGESTEYSPRRYRRGTDDESSGQIDGGDVEEMEQSMEHPRYPPREDDSISRPDDVGSTADDAVGDITDRGTQADHGTQADGPFPPLPPRPLSTSTGTQVGAPISSLTNASSNTTPWYGNAMGSRIDTISRKRRRQFEDQDRPERKDAAEQTQPDRKDAAEQTQPDRKDVAEQIQPNTKHKGVQFQLPPPPTAEQGSQWEAQWEVQPPEERTPQARAQSANPVQPEEGTRRGVKRRRSTGAVVDAAKRLRRRTGILDDDDDDNGGGDIGLRALFDEPPPIPVQSQTPAPAPAPAPTPIPTQTRKEPSLHELMKAARDKARARVAKLKKEKEEEEEKEKEKDRPLSQERNRSRSRSRSQIRGDALDPIPPPVIPEIGALPPVSSSNVSKQKKKKKKRASFPYSIRPRSERPAAIAAKNILKMGTSGRKALKSRSKEEEAALERVGEENGARREENIDDLPMAKQKRGQIPLTLRPAGDAFRSRSVSNTRKSKKRARSLSAPAKSRSGRMKRDGSLTLRENTLTRGDASAAAAAALRRLQPPQRRGKKRSAAKEYAHQISRRYLPPREKKEKRESRK